MDECNRHVSCRDYFVREKIIHYGSLFFTASKNRQIPSEEKGRDLDSVSSISDEQTAGSLRRPLKIIRFRNFGGAINSKKDFSLSFVKFNTILPILTRGLASVANMAAT